MTHPIVSLQTQLLAVLAADSALASLIGANAVFDAPPRGKAAPYVVISRHDLLARDGDIAPGNEHRLTLSLWHSEASRKAVLALAERVVAVVLGSSLGGSGLTVTHVEHLRTDSGIDAETGQARAAVSFRVFSEAG